MCTLLVSSTCAKQVLARPLDMVDGAAAGWSKCISDVCKAILAKGSRHLQDEAAIVFIVQRCCPAFLTGSCANLLLAGSTQLAPDRLALLTGTRLILCVWPIRTVSDRYFSVVDFLLSHSSLACRFGVHPYAQQGAYLSQVSKANKEELNSNLNKAGGFQA